MSERVEKIRARYPSQSVTRRLSVQQSHRLASDLHWLLEHLCIVEAELDEKDRLLALSGEEMARQVDKVYALKAQLADAERAREVCKATHKAAIDDLRESLALKQRELEIWIADCTAATQREGELREALKKYGSHGQSCRGAGCSCGFSAALLTPDPGREGA